MVYVAPLPLRRECALQLFVNQRVALGMNSFKVVFLLASMLFFAVLALDIAVPTLVLSIMALSNWLVLSSGSDGHQYGRGAA